jgi:hypothetical protein
MPPLASFNDLNLAGIKDILAVVANSSANSPLTPLTDSHTEALHAITTLLTGLASKPTPNQVEKPAPNQVEQPPTPTTEPVVATTARPHLFQQLSQL